MWVTTRSRKPESWVMMSDVLSFWLQRKFSSQATFLTSKWLVGSSRSMMSAFMRMARHRASFIFHPPERPEILAPMKAGDLGSSLKPNSSSFCMISSRELSGHRACT
mmetsp:Transcript_44751/g.93714  ORF Transcript_44751/g.93714 Transcript_44751/m.93714 type:complete len:107 (-) Transcript_44751:981-1301(-)